MKLGLKGMTSSAFVQSAWYEGVPARSIWFNGEKLYPDERTRVRDIVLDLTEDPYLKHAVDAAMKGQAFIEMELAGKRYHLYRGDGSLPVLKDVGGVFRADYAAGIQLSDCLDAEVIIRAVVPNRFSQQYYEPTGEDKRFQIDLPWLQNTKIRVWWAKGKKRVQAGVEFEVWGAYMRYSNTEDAVVGFVNKIASGYVFTDEHKRNKHYHWIPDDEHKWGGDKFFEDEYMDTAYAMRCTLKSLGSAVPDATKIEFLFPSFYLRKEARILGVTLQRK